MEVAAGQVVGDRVPPAREVTQNLFSQGARLLVPAQRVGRLGGHEADDTFVGGTAFSYMYMQNADGSFAELDTAYAFALIYGESFVGGTDTATNNDPNRNILVGFRMT